MVCYESSCVSCPSMGLPCLGSSCRNHGSYSSCVCDRCGCVAETLWDFDGLDICEDCLEAEGEKIFPEAGDGFCDRCGDDVEQRWTTDDGNSVCSCCLADYMKE